MSDIDEAINLLGNARMDPLTRVEVCARLAATEPKGAALKRAARELRVSLRSLQREAKAGAALASDVREMLHRSPQVPAQRDLIALSALDADAQRAVLAQGPGLAKALRTCGGARVEELEFQAHVMLALGLRHDLVLWRQNVGSVTLRDRGGATLRAFHAGPPKGAADLSGIVKPHGWRLEIELKADGKKRSDAQHAWQSMIRGCGGIYVLATYDNAKPLADNVALAVDAVEGAIKAREAMHRIAPAAR